MFGFLINIRRVKKNHPDLFIKISKIFIKYDPAGVFLGSNNDEYDLEVAHIIKNLRSCKSEKDVLNIIWRVLTRWFGQHVIKDKRALMPIALEIWECTK